MCGFRGGSRNPKLKPGFGTDVFCKTSAVHRLSSDFLHGDVSWELGGHRALLGLSIANQHVLSPATQRGNGRRRVHDHRDCRTRAGSDSFVRANREDWIAQHFFTGGVMPSHQLIRQYGDIFTIEKEWRWSGTHYQRTATEWLANFDAHRDRILLACATSMATRPVCGCGAGAGSSSRHQACSVAPTERSGGVSHYRMKAADDCDVLSQRAAMEPDSQSGESQKSA